MKDKAEDAGTYIVDKAETLYEKAKDTVSSYTPDSASGLIDKTKDVAKSAASTTG